MLNFRHATREEYENEIRNSSIADIGMVSVMAALIQATNSRLTADVVCKQAFSILDETKKQYEARMQAWIAKENIRRSGGYV